METKKGLNRSANLVGIHELTENELDTVTGGKAEDFEVIVDTEDARIMQDFTINDGKVKLGSSIKETFEKGKKDPFYHKDGKNNIHTIDLSNLK